MGEKELRSNVDCISFAMPSSLLRTTSRVTGSAAGLLVGATPPPWFLSTHSIGRALLRRCGPNESLVHRSVSHTARQPFAGTHRHINPPRAPSTRTGWPLHPQRSHRSIPAHAARTVLYGGPAQCNRIRNLDTGAFSPTMWPCRPARGSRIFLKCPCTLDPAARMFAPCRTMGTNGESRESPRLANPSCACRAGSCRGSPRPRCTHRRRST